MLRRFTQGLTALLLATTLAGTALGGAFAQRGGGGCPMPGMHDCCKRARQKSTAHGVTAARLCCIVNHPQPAPNGSNFTFQSSPGASDGPRPHAAQESVSAVVARPRDYSPPFKPSHSPPAYLRHAAFLI